jgi:hypothetical protein
MNLPANIDIKFVKTYSRRPFDDVDELIYVITWPDGSTEERFTIPNEWHNFYTECVKARHEANLAAMAKEHSEGRVGDVPILPSPILSQQEKAA